MKYAKGSTNRSLPVAPGIPGESDSRLEIGVIHFVKRSPCSWTYDGKDHRKRCRVGQQVRNVAVLFVRHSVQLVTQAQRQGKIAADFPSILTEPVIFVLTKKLVVGRLANLVLVEKLGRLVLNYESPQRERSIPNRLGTRIRGAGDIIRESHKVAAKQKYGVSCDLAAGIEIVSSALTNVSEVKAELEGMAAVNPAQGVGVTRSPGLTELVI